MENKTFVYVTYIRSTPKAVWEAITNPEFTRQYWGGGENRSTWEAGADWRHIANDEHRTVRIVGEVLESNPPRSLVLSWADPAEPNDKSIIRYEIEAVDELVSLKIVHSEFGPHSTMAGKVAWGWPRVLSSLKSFLETGKGINVWAGTQHRCG